MGYLSLIGDLFLALWDAIVDTRVIWIVNAALLALNLLKRRRPSLLRRGSGGAVHAR